VTGKTKQSTPLGALFPIRVHPREFVVKGFDSFPSDSASQIGFFLNFSNIVPNMEALGSAELKTHLVSLPDY